MIILDGSDFFNVSSRAEALKSSLNLILIRGLPGTGKTTMSEALLRRRVVETYWEADQYFSWEGGAYEFLPMEINHAHAWCQLNVRRQLTGKRSVAVSNVFARLQHIGDYAKVASELGAGFCVIEMPNNISSVDLALRSKHGLSTERIAEMRNGWEPLRR